ncbi:hypothetical protein NIES4073_73210 [Kalymmatonema gypsitolerans NIES-4073]|nr:hypothetical protein NIES4073_73210 [Scytonema sp. NIES-4073]
MLYLYPKFIFLKFKKILSLLAAKPPQVRDNKYFSLRVGRRKNGFTFLLKFYVSYFSYFSYFGEISYFGENSYFSYFLLF